MNFCGKHAFATVLVGILVASVSQAQFRPDYWEMQAEAERQLAKQARALERKQYETMLAERSARAHARMEEEGAFSGVTSTVDWQAAHPNVFGSGTGLYTNYNYGITQPRTFWSGPPTFPPDWLIWQDVAPDDEPIESLFSEYISQPIVQTKCVLCHVEGGVSGVGISRLQFSRSTVEDHVELNRAVFENFVATVEEPVDLILNKVQGVAHGGGMQLAAGTADYANLERFLRQLADESSTGSSTVTAENLFEGVTMASPARTLRRAAILFAGRLPTQTELDAVADGEEATLRSTIRGLMNGEAFHEFLIRAGNDRLLTDRQIGQGTIDLGSHEFVALNRKFAEMIRASISRGFEDQWQDPDYRTWEEALMNGFARAPLELIAHVVENDLPYTEILTADYIMANPMAAEAYGDSTTTFESVNDPFEFKPSAIVSYYREDESRIVERDETLDIEIVTNPGNLLTDYPHAGVLNTTAFLRRYPSTATNRNRARSRWTYYYFLGLDVEKSASRTTAAAALADTANPTMRNPACTVCHTVLDPVAGAFQNYGDEGLFRDQRGGLDSLDGQYKGGAGNSHRIYVEGETYQSRQMISQTVWLDPGSSLSIRHNHNNGCGEDGYETCGRDLRIGDFHIRNMQGGIVDRVEWSELKENCEYEGTYNVGSGGGDAHYQWWGWGCDKIPVQIPESNNYVLRMTVWADQSGDETTSFELGATLYQEGDTWYRDMRQPGFGHPVAPSGDNSGQWLAKQIVADNRFAEAAVKFWWPPIMGVEVLDSPENSGDPDFQGRLVAATAQAAELTRLADAFRTGIAGGSAYNGKDLLAEIALSSWFRAESVTGEDPVRMSALRDAGVARLLTPEELNRKTDAVAGYVWGRNFRQTMNPDQGATQSLLDGDSSYELLYGGINSDGIITRATDMAPVMAAVAQSHAAEVSCPIVRREFFFWEDEDRLLFDGVDKFNTPVSESYGQFEVTAETWDTRQTFSIEVPLTAGSKTVRLAFTNNYANEDEDRNLNVDRIEIRDSNDTIVSTIQLESIGSGHCRGPRGFFDSFHTFWCNTDISVPLEIIGDGVYEIDIVAHQDRAGDESARMTVTVESDDGVSAGATEIRGKLVDLHRTLLGVEVARDSADVNEAFNVFFEVWARKRRTEGTHFGDSIFQCHDSDHTYYEGLVDFELKYHEWGGSYTERDQIDELYDSTDMSDPTHAVRAWVVTLAYLMTDFRYLYF